MDTVALLGDTGLLFAALRTVLRARKRGPAVKSTSAPESEITGGCLCGGCRFAYRGCSAPAQILVCHCSMCRRAIGAAGVPFAALPRKRLVYAQRASLREYRSSSFATRFFCGRCGCSIRISYDCEVSTDWVNVACLDWPGGAFDPAISSHIHNDSRAAYEDLESLPTFDGFDSWVVDVCRPEGEAVPWVCDKCYHLRGRWTCTT